MSEMVERVGEALRVKLIEWYDGGIGFEDGGIMLARAAIEAMREPTDGMMKAGFSEIEYLNATWVDEYDAMECWQAMIDAALGDG